LSGEAKTNTDGVVTPFAIHASDTTLADLDRRLEATRWPTPAGEGWALGTERRWLESLVEYWRDDFDWRAQEASLNESLPGQRVTIRGLKLHFATVPSGRPDAIPLLLLHGWPSSFVEMHRLAPLLAHPGEFGAPPEQAFDLVVASLPGHGFSSAPEDPAFGADDAADCLRDLMVDVLGHDRFGVHGGDRGAFVATGLAHGHPEHVIGIHQSLALGLPGTPPSDAERVWLEETAAWNAEEGGYSAIQGTRPLSLAYAIGDSPVGLAAWICEKFRAWSDCNGDPLTVFTRDELLTNVMIYWLSGCFYPSARFYWAHRHAPPAATQPVRVEVPMGVCLFPKEVMRPPRSAVERKYALEHWTEPTRGGHFPALEAPGVLAEDLRTFFRRFRPA
jgi:microsomal epoxide hydrolase